MDGAIGTPVLSFGSIPFRTSIIVPILSFSCSSSEFASIWLFRLSSVFLFLSFRILKFTGTSFSSSTGNTISPLKFCTPGDGINTEFPVSSALNTFRISGNRFSIDTSYGSFGKSTPVFVSILVNRSSIVFLSPGSTSDRRDVPTTTSSPSNTIRLSIHGSSTYVVSDTATTFTSSPSISKQVNTIASKTFPTAVSQSRITIGFFVLSDTF